MSRIVLPRRRVLQGLGASVGLAACGTGSTPAGRKPTAQERGKIDTIVICMMENRSFDHVFGSLSLLEGRTEIDGLLPGMSNLDLDGVEVPINPLATPCTEPDPPHGWSTSRTQLDGGTCGGFVLAYQGSHGRDIPTHQAMSYQTRQMQPISYALADEYALCQRWFSSLLTSTWPNRLYFHAAQNQGLTGNSLPPEGAYTCRTIWDQLTEAGVDWGYYFTDLPTLALFGRSEWAPHLATMEQFYADAAAGALPPVVCVDAGAGYNDDHPPHHPMLGQYYVASVYQALARSPHWDRCLFVLTYDEAGGFFDHVAPGTMRDDRAAEGFDQLGFRVPALVAGPYVRNVVSDTRFDHTAALTFVQDHFGIDERLTKRNEASNDLSELLDADALAANAPRPPIDLPPIERSEEEIAAECDAAGRRTGQPELRDFVRDRFPWLDRTSELPQIGRRFWRTLGEQGLWVPK